MASLARSALLSIALTSAVNAVAIPQTDSSSTTAASDSLPSELTDADFWCNTLDTKDAEAVAKIWEEGNCNADGECGIGAPSKLLEEHTREEGSRDNWLFNLTSTYMKNAADAGTGDCGGLGATCDPNPSCTDLAAEGHADVYWILRAVAGLQSKLNIAHSYLQDQTIKNTLVLSDIADDFSAPESFNTMAMLAGLISASFFVVGGVAGAGSVVAGFAAVSAAGALGVAQGEKARAIGVFENERTDKQLAQAKKFDSIAQNGGRGAGAMSSGTYLVGSTFSLISATSDAENQVTSGDLDNTLGELFETSLGYLKQFGRLAVGDADEGEDYNWLPHKDGYGPTELTSPIAGFFADGKYLLSASDDSFNKSIEAAFGQFATKVVDQAMITGGLMVISPDIYDDEESCLDPDASWAGYGARWIDFGDGNSHCMQMYRKPASGAGDVPTVAEKEITDKLISKYDFNLDEFYKAVYFCNKDGPEDREVDVLDLPTDESLPLCWFAIEGKRMGINNDCTSRCELPRWRVNYYDFGDGSSGGDDGEEEGPTEPTASSQGDTGCYSGGHSWSDLHGSGSNTDTQEVKNDINSRCSAADGTTLKAGDFWWDCTEWEDTVDGGVNHIWWEIQIDGDNNQEKTVSKDACISRLETELGGCSTGSEQKDGDGLWFKIDPNAGACPFKKE